MGLTSVKMTISNPFDGKSSEVVEFLVDSGATHSFVDAKTLKRLGIKPDGEKDFVLANGELISRKLGKVIFRFGDKEALSHAVFAEEGDEQLLGVVTLENMGLGLNPIQRTLVPLKFRA
ncbi:retroviral-like aspartic protease [candidate division WWE3 bacterium]|nr:retroviral-like aspartic protease [candidate division WWE3 bacterium]